VLELESEKNRKLEQLMDTEDQLALLRKEVEELRQELADEKLKNSAKFQDIQEKTTKRIAHLKYFHEHIMTRLQKSHEKYGSQLNDKISALEQEKLTEMEKLKQQASTQLNELEAQRQRKADHLR